LFEKHDPPAVHDSEETLQLAQESRQKMAFEQSNSKPGLQSMTSGQISSGLDLTYAPSIITTQQPTEGELDLLFEAMYDDHIGGQPSAAPRTVSAAQAPQVLQTPTTTTTTADTAPAPTNSSSQATTLPNTSQDVDKLETQQHVQHQPATIADNVPNAMFDDNTFVNTFATPSTSDAESSSSQYVNPSNMHMFYQPYPYEYQWTKDHPLEGRCLVKLGVIEIDIEKVSHDHPSHVFKLKKALYGLKQAPRAWSTLMILSLGLHTLAPDISHHSLKMTVPSTTEEKISRRMIQSKKSSSIWLFQNEHQLTLARASKLDSKIGNSWARKSYQRTGRKIIIDGSSTAGYDKSKVECFNCHKMGHFARECRVPRSKDNRSWNQGNSSKTVRIEDASEKAMCAIDGGGFDWSDMAEDEIQANMALMAVSDSEVSCSKSCVLKYEALKKQYDDLLVKLDDTAFKASTYKRGLSILEAQVVKYKESEVLFSEEIAFMKEVTDKSKKGFGYNAVPSPHPLILNRPTPLDLSYSGLEEFQQPEINWYGPRNSSSKPTTVCNKESNNSKENIDESLILQPKSVTVSSTDVPTLKVDTKWKEKFFNQANNVRLEEPKKASENTDAPIIEDWVSDDEEEAESTPKVEKKIPIATKEASVNNDKPSRRTISILMKTGLKTVKNTKPLSTVRSVNTARPVSTVRARGFNAVKPSACWVWRPIKPNGASLSNSQLNEKGFVDSGCSRHMSGNIAHLSDFKEFDGGLCYFWWSVQIEEDSLMDASYFEDSSLKSVADAQIQDQDVPHDDCSFQDDGFDEHQVNTAIHSINNTGSGALSTATPEVNTATSEGLMGPIPTPEDTQEEDQAIDLGNLSPSYAVSSTPHTRIHKDHPIDHVIGDVQSSVQTRKEPKRVSKALSDPAWVEAMQEELLQFKLQNVWVLVDLPKGHRAIGTKWVYRNKKDERGIVVRNKARLVAQGHTQEEGIDYDEVYLHQWQE
ncbi:retrovirus-related pol polyprotein from transposon TNT 1-94, partial [Tanacetum coccineum]